MNAHEYNTHGGDVLDHYKKLWLSWTGSHARSPPHFMYLPPKCIDFVTDAKQKNVAPQWNAS